MKRYLTAAALGLMAALAQPVQAADIVDEWTSIKAPSAPMVKEVKVDPKATALLMLDFMNQSCGKRQRCIATIPAMKTLLAAARAAKATIIYSLPPGNLTTADIMSDVAPQADEPHVQSGPDKYLNTDLDKILKEKGIKTVIPVGTSSNGAVLFTGAGAAFRGLNVVVPVDGMSSVEAIAEYATVIDFQTAPLVSNKTTPTRSTMIKF